MSKYFDYFPKIKYGEKVMRDITKNVRVFDDIENDPYAFMPYTVNDGESPEEIAQYYYESVDHVWIVYQSNAIVDPYFQWPLSNKALEETMIRKYRALAEQSTETEMSDQSVLQWTQQSTESMFDNVVYYYDAEGTKISVDTFKNGSTNSTIVSSDWTAMRIYDEELQLNEDKRNIRLLNNQYLNVATKNLKRVLNV